MRLLVPVRLAAQVRLLVPVRLAAQLDEPCATRLVALVLAVLEQKPADAARRYLDRKKRSSLDSVDDEKGG